MTEATPAPKIGHQTAFEHDAQGRLVLLVIFLLVGVTILLGISLWQLATRPKPQYFQASNANQILKEGPLDTPFVSTSALLNWVTEAALSGLSFNYTNYVKVLENNKVYYTQDGYKSFMNQVNDTPKSPVSISVLQRTVLHPEPRDAPSVILEGAADMMVDGLAGRHYAWKIELPLLLQYHGYNQVRTDTAKLVLKVIRVPTLDSQVGLKIQEYQLSVTSTVGGNALAVPSR